MKCPKCNSKNIYKNKEKFRYGWCEKELCLNCGHVQLTPIYKKKHYSVAYSKTDEDGLLEDGHLTKGSIINRCDLEKVVELLNEKEEEIFRLKLEISYLEEKDQ